MTSLQEKVQRSFAVARSLVKEKTDKFNSARLAVGQFSDELSKQTGGVVRVGILFNTNDDGDRMAEIYFMKPDSTVFRDIFLRFFYEADSCFPMLSQGWPGPGPLMRKASTAEELRDLLCEGLESQYAADMIDRMCKGHSETEAP
jgi:hypothetical protein